MGDTSGTLIQQRWTSMHASIYMPFRLQSFSFAHPILSVISKQASAQIVSDLGQKTLSQRVWAQVTSE